MRQQHLLVVKESSISSWYAIASHAAPVVCTVGDEGVYPHRPVRLLIRMRARAAVVRQLKVSLGFKAILPHGPPAKQKDREGERNERLGSDYKGMISTIEDELCAVEGMGGRQLQRNLVEEKEPLIVGRTHWAKQRPKLAGPENYGICWMETPFV